MYFRVTAGERVDGAGRPLAGTVRGAAALLLKGPGAGIARVVQALATRRRRD
jgi:hypothetical protein